MSAAVLSDSSGKKYGEYVEINGIYRYQLPKPPSDEKEILFAGLKVKDQHWRRTPQPLNWKELPPKKQGEFIEREVRRMFIDGAWFANKGSLVYLTPFIYFFLNWWKFRVGGTGDDAATVVRTEYAKFRKAQYHEMLFEEFAEAIPNCIGTVGFKKRRDGRTSRAMARMVWKAIQPKYKNSWLGMQSKTGPDARDVCWEILMAGYRGLPGWMKPEQAGTSDPKKRLELAKPSVRMSRNNVREVLDEDDTGLNTTIDYRDTVENAYDGQEALEICIDEFAKWKKANVVKTIGTYVRSVFRDGLKVGHLKIFSSPSEERGKEHDRSITVWNMADPAKSIAYDEEGKLTILKKSWFLLRVFTGALEGYGEACDVYGDCDQELAEELIQEELDNAEPEMKAGLERQMPKTIDDILEGVDSMVFSHAQEMKDQMTFLKNRDFKDDAGTEPCKVYGNLEWKGAVPDSGVIWKPSKDQKDFSESGRFCFQYHPEVEMQNRLVQKKKYIGGEAKMVFDVPDDCENVIGIDPYDYRRTESKNVSKGAAGGGKALDFYDMGDANKIFFAYLWRPGSPTIFYEDMIKASMYCTAYVQVESKNKNIIDHFEDRGYFDVLLAKTVKQPKSEHKGNPTTVPLIDEMCSLLDAFYTPEQIREMYMAFVLGDHLKFDPGNTLTAHITMAFGQMLLGFMKRRLTARKKRKRVADGLNQQISQSIMNIYNLQ